MALRCDPTMRKSPRSAIRRGKRNRIALLPVLFAFPLALVADPIRIRQVENRAYGLKATVILVPEAENRDFFAIDVPRRTDGDDVRKHWKWSYAFLLNGGYFRTDDFTPVGLTRIDGVEIHSEAAPRLAGFVTIDGEGRLRVLTKTDEVGGYATVIQSGPFLIDPGGYMGIKSSDGRIARRTVVGSTKDRTLVFAVTEEITLSNLARAMLAEFPSLDRLLNLDGGPSTAIMARSVRVLNAWPVRNYIGRKNANNGFWMALHLTWLIPGVIVLIAIWRRKRKNSVVASAAEGEPAVCARPSEPTHEDTRRLD